MFADLGMTMAAVVDDLGRRLSFMELALEVKFQVILPGLSHSKTMRTQRKPMVFACFRIL